VDTTFELVKNGPKGPEQLGEELYTQKLSRRLFNTSFTRRVNGMVNGLVIRVFHAPVTLLSKF
jgi:hypothetical protein